PADQTVVHQFLDTTGVNTFWVQTLIAPVAAAGTVATINNPSPTSDRWNAAAVEILVGVATTTPPPPPVTVPNVVGLTQAAASTALVNAGLVVGTVTQQSSTTVPAGSVISQLPAAGAQADSGSAVDLVVSSGPPQVAVPNVVGLTQTAATTAITNAGLVVGTI